MLYKFFLFLFCFSFLSAKETLDCDKASFSRIKIKQLEPKGVGFNDGYTSLSLFLTPSSRSFFIPFFDGRFHVFNNGYIASNFGIGARFATPNDAIIIGLNTYYDFRNYKSFSSHQSSSGIEVLTKWVDIRLTGYYPFSGKTKESESTFSHFQGHAAYLQQKIRYALPSTELEVGYTLPGPCKQLGLYLAAGGYYLFKQSATNHSIGDIAGGKVRLTASPNRFFTFGVEYTYDSLFGGITNGYISLQIPLGKSQPNYSDKKTYSDKQLECKRIFTSMTTRTQDVIHNEIIPFYSENFHYPISSFSGENYNFIFVNNKQLAASGIGSGDGSFENPYTTLALAQNNSSPHDVIYVFFGNGTSAGYDQGFQFQSNQYLTSSAFTLNLGGIDIRASTPGSLPFISNTGSPTIVASNAGQITINGFNLSSNGANTISLTSTGALIANNTVTAPSAYTTLLDESPLGTTSLIANTFNGQGPSIIGGSSNAPYTISNNQFHITNAQMGLSFTELNQNLIVTSNTFFSDSPLQNAINFINSGNNILSQTYKNNTIGAGFANGLSHTWNGPAADTFTAQNNTFNSSSLLSGINYTSSSQNGSELISNNTITATQGIVLDYQSGYIGTSSITNNTISSSSLGSYGINVTSQGSPTFTAQNNIVNSSNLIGNNHGISFAADSPNLATNNLTILNNTITINGGSNGINITNSLNSVIHGRVDGNSINLLSPEEVFRGIRIYTSSMQPTCVNVINNNNVLGYEFVTFGSGYLQLPSNSASLAGFIAQNGNVATNNTNILGNVTFVLPGSVCPPFTAVFVDNTANLATANGSFSNPWTTLLDAQNHSKPGDLIYVYTGDGTTKGYNAGITLQESQVLAGSSVSFSYNGGTIPGSGGSEPQISNDSGSVIITAPTSARIVGFAITESSTNTSINYTQSSSPNSIASVEQCQISGTLSSAQTINITGSGVTFSLLDNTITTATGSVNTDLQSNSSIILNGNHLECIANGSMNIFSNFTGGNNSINISNNNIQSNGDAIKVTSNSGSGTLIETFENNLIEGHLCIGQTLQGASTTLTLKNNMLIADNFAFEQSFTNPFTGTITANTCTSPAGTASPMEFDIHTSACFTDFSQNSASSFIFSPTSPSVSVNFQETQAYINQNNTGTFNFTGDTVTYGSPCP